ncbi:MAG: PEP-CTERM sorting domain-containing protein [Syntrophobacterales bacterium]|nr:MAG: PEP-CTERM sorting domain-containing protein [Syntrophobacterales bacterium]
MKKTLRKFSIPAAFLFMLLWVVASVASASDFGPKNKPGQRNRAPGSVQSVAEPAAIVLLATGLVSLGLYAKRKRGKKQ